MTSSQRARGGWLPYVVMGVIAIVCLVTAAGRSGAPESAEDRVNAVAETIRCPTCQGESVADSNAPSSRDIRTDIADRLSRGETAEQIRSYYAQSYGDAILLTPRASGVASLVWIVPVVALVVTATGLIVVFRRWRRTGDLHANESDRQRVHEALADRAGNRDDRSERPGPS
jgi:cytochrome c-type biogenesis protein CcmH